MIIFLVYRVFYIHKILISSLNESVSINHKGSRGLNVLIDLVKNSLNRMTVEQRGITTV